MTREDRTVGVAQYVIGSLWAHKAQESSAIKGTVSLDDSAVHQHRMSHWLIPNVPCHDQSSVKIGHNQEFSRRLIEQYRP